VGDYFDQLWKTSPVAASKVYGINMNAIDSIANSTDVYQGNLTLLGQVMEGTNITVAGQKGQFYAVLNWTGGNVLCGFTVKARYITSVGNTSTPGPTIVVTYTLKRINALTGQFVAVDTEHYDISPGQTVTATLVWNESNLVATGLEPSELIGVPEACILSFAASPASVSGGEVYPTSPSTLAINWLGWQPMGDLGGYPPSSYVPAFGYYTGSCGPADIPLFILCYRGEGPF